jgi:hypothetical protein
MYTTHREILSRLRMSIKSKPIYEAEILMWCQILEVEILADERFFYKIREHKVPVLQENPKFCEIPVNVFKIRDVYTDRKNRDTRNSPFVNHFNTGDQLVFNQDFKGEYVYLDYLGMPFMTEAPYYPLILKGHELACEAYCKYKLFEEDILLGKMSGELLIQTRDQEILAAKSATERFKTRADKDMEQFILKDMIPNYGRRDWYDGVTPPEIVETAECECEGIGCWIIEDPDPCYEFIVS